MTFIRKWSFYELRMTAKLYKIHIELQLFDEKKRSNDETENERHEAIESVSVIDGLITSRIVYENNTVND